MANTVTELIRDIFAESMNHLSKAVSMPKLVTTDWSNEVAQKGSTIDIHIPSAMTVSDVTPSQTPPAGQDVAPDVVSITLNKWRKTELHLTDKEAGEIAKGLRPLQLSAAMSALSEDINTNLLALYKDVYGYAGVAGTTPFTSDLSELIDAEKVLFDQKCPAGNRNTVISSAAKAKLLNLRAIQDFMGPDAIKTGRIGTVLGFGVAPDQQVPTHTTTGAGTVLVNDAAHAAGATTVTWDGGGTEPATGDVFTVAGDDQTYVVVDSTATVITFEPPCAAGFDDNAAITFKASHVANMAFHPGAFALAIRPLAPADGFTGGNVILSDMDPNSGVGMTLEVSREYGRTKYEWRVLYGVKTLRPELACRIAG